MQQHELKEIQVTMFWAHAWEATQIEEENRIGWGDKRETFEKQTFSWNTECNVSDHAWVNTLDNQICEELYAAQGNSHSGNKLFDSQCSLSIGDIIELPCPCCNNTNKYLVIPVGFMVITEEQFGQWCKESFRDRSFYARKLSKSQV